MARGLWVGRGNVDCLVLDIQLKGMYGLELSKRLSGVYCLRTNEMHRDAATLWQTDFLLTDLEAVFRSLKSELGLTPGPSF
jgi:DNA-binding LytR/AlgR family response regulator